MNLSNAHVLIFLVCTSLCAIKHNQSNEFEEGMFLTLSGKISFKCSTSNHLYFSRGYTSWSCREDRKRENNVDKCIVSAGRAS